MTDTEGLGPVSEAKLRRLIEDARRSGASERSNFQLFMLLFCEALGLPKPTLFGTDGADNDYIFERQVAFHHPDGTTSPGWIDLYRRDCFILEAKQSAKRPALAGAGADMPLEAPVSRGRAAARAEAGLSAHDRFMLQARRQAESYARALPAREGYPPFLLILDIGNVLEIHADFSGLGKHYAPFPDGNTYRLRMDDLLDAGVQDRLRRIWTDPLGLNPARKAARVTRAIAERLALLARRLERRHEPGAVADFLMRCVFTIFAEDIGLLREKPLRAFLATHHLSPEGFAAGLTDLWAKMDQGGYWPMLNVTIRRFNGWLFKQAEALPLEPDEINELKIACGAGDEWQQVEPVIFGTLLEQALNPAERARLGAHFTPRAYVEQIVAATVMEPLRADWVEAQTRAADLAHRGDASAARAVVLDFLHRLCTTRVLDPACGTGNFLYVALEMMKRLEGEVLLVATAMGVDAPRLALDGETVSPRQFLGLDCNARAVPIARLVVWIGYLKWHLKENGVASIPDPVLREDAVIREQDAVISWDGTIPVTDPDTGDPLTRWDGVTTRIDPVTGEDVPDPEARVPILRYVNPRRAPWPEAEFIVGNPPFIAGKDMRQELGDGYAEACWAARPHLPGGADFVMHFWDEAATLLTARMPRGRRNPLRRFGFITTNSVTQSFSRRVIEHHRKGENALSLVFAVPDHPWLKGRERAAVRIAMTVAERGAAPGILAEVMTEDGLDTDTPRVTLSRRTGAISARLRLGADVTAARPLLANEELSSRGVVLHGKGFIVTPERARGLGLGSVAGLEAHILDYRHGRDLTGTPRGVKVIDLYPLDIETVRDRFPRVFQHVYDHVKPERDQNRDPVIRANWWLFGRPRPELRDFIAGLPRYIATVETAKQRFFQFLDASVQPDNKLVAMGLEGAEHLAVLSSLIHCYWYQANAGLIGVFPLPAVYVKTAVFDPFPFPDFGRMGAEARGALAELGEILDATRKRLQAEHRGATMTALYNALERGRAARRGTGPALTEAEREFRDRVGLAGLEDIHDRIDRAVLAAYGWDDLAEPLVGAPGATCVTDAKDAAQEAAEADLLERLVALNAERVAAEARGEIAWLRPAFQRPRLAPREVAQAEQFEADFGDAPMAAGDRPAWPADGLEQIRVVRDLIADQPRPASLEEVARAFRGRLTAQRRERVRAVLETLEMTGAIRTPDRDGDTSPKPARYFVMG